MGTFSIWHWIVILFIFLMPVIAIATEKTDLKTTRINFLIWLFGVSLGSAVFGSIIPLIVEDQGAARIVVLVFGLCLVFPLYRQYVRRARDSGMGKTIAYLSVIPLVNLITTLILLFKKGAFQAATETSSDETSHG